MSIGNSYNSQAFATNSENFEELFSKLQNLPEN